jgi:hypothetical protein
MDSAFSKPIPPRSTSSRLSHLYVVLAICEQMAELLPEKINHAHYINKLLS